MATGVTRGRRGGDAILAPPRPERLAMRLLAGDEAGAWEVMQAAVDSGVSREAVMIDLLLGAMRHVGDRWEEGRIGVYEEHRATTVALRLVGRFGSAFELPPLTGSVVVLGCAPGDLHSLPVAVASDLLRWQGVESVDLGGNVPVESFVDAAAEAHARARLVAVGVCATSRASRVSAWPVVRALRDAGIEHVVVGGADVRDEVEARRVGSSAYCHDVRAFVDQVLAWV